MRKEGSFGQTFTNSTSQLCHYQTFHPRHQRSTIFPARVKRPVTDGVSTRSPGKSGRLTKCTMAKIRSAINGAPANVPRPASVYVGSPSSRLNRTRWDKLAASDSLWTYNLRDQYHSKTDDSASVRIKPSISAIGFWIQENTDGHRRANLRESMLAGGWLVLVVSKSLAGVKMPGGG